MTKNKKYRGFTLVQIMIVLFVVSMIMAASAPMITRVNKKIPARAAHGKYICYPVENGYKEMYFNSKTDVSDANVDECKFISPSKVASYKVELVGAGGGGNSESISVSESNTTYNANYKINSQLLSGNYLVEPTNDQYREWFNRSYVQRSASTGRGGNGQRISHYYLAAPDAYCRATVYLYTYDEDGIASYTEHSDYALTFSSDFDNFMNKYSYNHFFDAAKSDIESACASYYASGEYYINQDDKPDIKIINNARETVVRTTTITGYEEKGSPLSYFTASENVNIPTGVDAKSYLSNWISKIQVGHVDDSGKFHIGAPMSGKDASPATSVVSWDDENVNIGDKGEDASGYAAIKFPDGVQVASSKALGGDGGWIEYDYETGLVKGSTLETQPIAGNSSSSVSHDPSLTIKTILNSRSYSFGGPGHPGKYLSETVADFGGECVITPGKAGEVGSDGEQTVIDCPKYYREVEGGKKGGTASDSFELFSLLKSKSANNWSKWTEVDLSNETKTISASYQDQGEYKPNKNVYMYYEKLKELPHFGKGGEGVSGTDTEIYAYGSVETYMDGSLVNSLLRQKRSSDNLNTVRAGIVEEPATKGKCGAVIITW